jgi:hypothetical protein
MEIPSDIMYPDKIKAINTQTFQAIIERNMFPKGAAPNPKGPFSNAFLILILSH